jgi:hypothetical protein
MWTGTNALFSRDSILSLTFLPRPLPNVVGELARFRVLYEFAAVPDVVIHPERTLLNQLLRMDYRSQPLPGVPVQPSYTMWEIISHKYTVTTERTRGVGKLIADTLAAGATPYLDVPTIIYAARNWNVHGVLLSSSFRGTRRKYVTFIESLMLVLSEVLTRTATKLHAIL